MKIKVLLSAARHPVSSRPCLSRLEAQAIGLAERLGGDITGVHVGNEIDGLTEALGSGLSVIDRLGLPTAADPVPVLQHYLAEQGPDLILAGRRGQGGEDTGLTPYFLAEALDLPIIADAVAIEKGDQPGTIRVDQALKKGARRRVTLRLPAIVTVHPLAPAPVPFAYGASRRGEIRSFAVSVEPVNAVSTPRWIERPFRNRPKLMRTAGPAGSEASEKLFVEPEPMEAARLILDYLERNGIRRF